VNGRLSLDLTGVVHLLIPREWAISQSWRSTRLLDVAKNILVQCSQNEAHVFITVEDDGIGFDVNKTAGQNGIGLSNIKSRVEFLKGKFEIHSAPGEGTTVNIEVSTNE